MESIQVDFVGTPHEVTTSLTFGRSADLCLDEDNRYMHRVCGEFRVDGGVAWLFNRGSATRISVFAENGTRVDLPPGERTTLSGPSGTVSFVAGPTPYELTYTLVGYEHRTPLVSDGGPDTFVFGAELTPREIDFIVAFARPRLEGGNDVLTYAEVAALWGVSPKTVDNTLQGLRRKLKAGGARDIDSIEALVGHLLAHGRVGREHLEHADFDSPDGPVSASAE